MSGMLKNLLPWISKTPKKPTPIPNVPSYNPLGSKRPAKPTVIPGVPPYNGPSAPGS